MSGGLAQVVSVIRSNALPDANRRWTYRLYLLIWALTLR